MVSPTLRELQAAARRARPRTRCSATTARHNIRLVGDSNIAAAVIGGVAGVVTGGLASIVAPWANWGVDKRRERQQDRRALVASWRAGLMEFDRRYQGGPWSVGDFQGLLRSADWYGTLRRYLPDALRDEIEKGPASHLSEGQRAGLTSNATVVVSMDPHLGGQFRHPYTRKLETEVDRIADGWKIP